MVCTNIWSLIYTQTLLYIFDEAFTQTATRSHECLACVYTAFHSICQNVMCARVVLLLPAAVGTLPLTTSAQYFSAAQMHSMNWISKLQYWNFFYIFVFPSMLFQIVYVIFISLDFSQKRSQLYSNIGWIQHAWSRISVATIQMTNECVLLYTSLSRQWNGLVNVQNDKLSSLKLFLLHFQFCLFQIYHRIITIIFIFVDICHGICCPCHSIQPG